MAYDTLRASGNNQYGQMSDVDRANFGSQQQAQDFILRKRLQDEALSKTDTNEAARLAAEQAMQDKALAAQQTMGGTFAEKQAAEDARAKRFADPQMEMLRQAAEERKTVRDEGAPERQLKLAIRNEFAKRAGISLPGMDQGAAAGGIPMGGDMKSLRALGSMEGINIPETDDEVRAKQFESAQIAAALGKYKQGGMGAKEAGTFLTGKGFPVADAGNLFGADPAEERANTEKATAAYASSPTVLRQVSAMVPALVESAKQSPGGIQFAVQQAVQTLAQNAAKEGADPAAVSGVLAKQLATVLQPELEKLRPGAGAFLMKLLAHPISGAFTPYDTPIAADVLKQGGF